MSYFPLMPRQNGPFHEKCNGNNLYFSLPSVQNLNVATTKLVNILFAIKL